MLVQVHAAAYSKVAAVGDGVALRSVEAAADLKGKVALCLLPEAVAAILLPARGPTRNWCCRGKRIAGSRNAGNLQRARLARGQSSGARLVRSAIGLGSRQRSGKKGRRPKNTYTDTDTPHGRNPA